MKKYQRVLICCVVGIAAVGVMLALGVQSQALKGLIGTVAVFAVWKKTAPNISASELHAPWDSSRYRKD